VLEFLADLLVSVFGVELGTRTAVNHEIREMRRTGKVTCLYRDTAEGDWLPKPCRVVPGGFEFTMYPFGASFVLRTTAPMKVVGSGPAMALGPTTRLVVMAGDREAQLAVPDAMVDWLVTEASNRASH